MKQNSNTVLVFGFAALLTASALSAHHAFAPTYDADKVVDRKGVISRIEWMNPHSFIFVETKDANGVAEQSALEGPSPNQFARKLIDRSIFKVGDAIEFCGYAARDPNKVITPQEPISLSLKSIPREPGHLLLGELLTFPDGRNVVWSDYGQRKCRDAHNLK